MKAISFVLLIFMLIISVASGSTAHVNARTKKDCCINMAGMSKNHEAKKACDGGMCATMLACSNCCFLKTDAVTVTRVAAIFNDKIVTPYLAGNVAGYSITCWNPPKV